MIRLCAFSDEAGSDIYTQIDALKRNNIKLVELRSIDNKNVSDFTIDDAKEYYKIFKENDIEVFSIGSPLGKVDINVDFDEYEKKIRHTFEISKIFNCNNIRMFSFFNAYNDEELVFKYLNKMVNIAKEYDLSLFHENEKDIYGDTADRCIDLMKELSCDHFKAVFDPANFVQSKQDTLYAYENLKDYIAYMHIKDAKFADGSVVPAGAGDGNVEKILKDLMANGYDGFLSLEPHLGSFAGLAALELDDKMESLPEGGEGTFTLAYRALCGILERIRK